MSRLTIDVSEQQHKALKAMAALKGKTIKQYVLEKLFPAALQDASADEDTAWQELSTLLRQRISDGRPSSQSFDEIVEARLKQARKA